MGSATSLPNRLGVVAAAFSADPREAPRLARVAGFKGLVFETFAPNLNLPELSDSGGREFLRMLSSQDQQLIALRCDLGSKGFLPGADVDREIARLDRAMESASKLRAPLVCVDLGPLPNAPPAAIPRKPIVPQDAGLIIVPEPAAPAPAAPAAPPDAAQVSQLTAALDQVGASADRFSVRLAFSTSLASFASLDAALRSVRCPWFGVDLDPVAILRDDWSVDQILSTSIGEALFHFRARDATVGADKRTKPAPISRGDTKWSHLLAQLEGAGYNGFLTLDPMELPDRAAGAIAGAKYLRLLAE